MRILIVEDHPITLWSLEEGLNEKGYSEIFTATHAKEALTLFRKHRPDLVILDINLLEQPDGGIELAHVFRAIERIPIIFLTGEVQSEVIRKAIAARPSNYLVKPVDFDELAANIELAISNFALEGQNHMYESSSDLKLGADIIFQKNNMLYFKKKSRFEKIVLNEIFWVQAENVYTDLHLKTGRETLSMTLKRFEEQVYFSSFVKINRSQLVNVNYVDSFESHRLFIGDHQFRITDKYKAGFFEAFTAA